MLPYSISYTPHLKLQVGKAFLQSCGQRQDFTIWAVPTGKDKVATNIVNEEKPLLQSDRDREENAADEFEW